jgi:hypothetical protein
VHGLGTEELESHKGEFAAANELGKRVLILSFDPVENSRSYRRATL